MSAPRPASPANQSVSFTRRIVLPLKAPFTFGIPLLPRACARNWALVECLLELTLTSILAQSDEDFRIIVAGHDRPDCLPEDLRVAFLQAGWPAGPQRSDNLDRGRKVQVINETVLGRGGGFLMFVDADDWVDTRLVEQARALIGPDVIGGVVLSGYATDFRTLRTAALPDERLFPGRFHEVCGSSTVALLRPGERDPLRRDPHRIMHEHFRWTELAAELRAPLVELPVHNNYLINTSENHSELHGPFTAWRREFTQAVNRFGTPIGSEFAVRFGIDEGQLRAVSARFP